jgi:hypothetical protein
MLRGPVKINPVTQTVTDICLDPLCDHREECPLYGSRNFYITGNYLFFFRRNDELSSTRYEHWFNVDDFCVYDMQRGTVRKLGEYWLGSFSVRGGTGSYLYYSVNTRIEDEEQEDHMFLRDFVMYRADAKTGEIIEIPLYGDYTGLSNDSRVSPSPNLVAIIGDTLYWHIFDVENRTLIAYTTDLDGNNRIMLDGVPHVISHSVSYHNGYIYHPIGRPLPGFEDDYSVWRQNNHLYRIPSVDGSAEVTPADGSDPDHPFGEDAELIAESVITFVIHGDKIYFQMMQEEPELVTLPEDNPARVRNRERYNLAGGKLYVMNLDGTDKRLVADTGRVFADSATEMHRIFEVKTINGVDYIALAFSELETDYCLSDTIIINASTGEWVVLSVPE